MCKSSVLFACLHLFHWQPESHDARPCLPKAGVGRTSFWHVNPWAVLPSTSLCCFRVSKGENDMLDVYGDVHARLDYSMPLHSPSTTLWTTNYRTSTDYVCPRHCRNQVERTQERHTRSATSLRLTKSTRSNNDLVFPRNLEEATKQQTPEISTWSTWLKIFGNSKQMKESKCIKYVQKRVLPMHSQTSPEEHPKDPNEL